jgi:hypothetical protein
MNVRPYRGLSPFTEADAAWMFGRDSDVAKLLKQMSSGCRLTAVVGASGSGKSSLVLAGLVPAVRTGQLDGSYEWRVVVMRPGRRPCHALAEAVVALGQSDPVTKTAQLGQLRRRLLASGDTLADAAGVYLAPSQREARLLLVIDQFEELFTEAAAPHDNGRGLSAPSEARINESASAFVRNIVQATVVPDGRVHVVATLRADFLESCLLVPGLADRLQEAVQFALPPMKESQLRDAIRRPALRAGFDLEPSVIDGLLQSVLNDPGRLPLLQFALSELWEKRDRNRKVMTYGSYQELGRLDGAISRRAETVFNELSADEQIVCRQIFCQLVHLGTDTGDTRRRVSRDEVSDDARALRILDKLARARLVTASKEGFEVAHEALIRTWDRLQQWSRDDREFILWSQRLAPRHRAWRQGRGELLRV